jgi:hypothetical protein
MNWFHPHVVARRAAVARLVIWTGLGLLLVAFFRAQVLSAGRYQLASEQNRLRAVPIPAPRGLIVDRHGEVLAENEPCRGADRRVRGLPRGPAEPDPADARAAGRRSSGDSRTVPASSVGAGRGPPGRPVRGGVRPRGAAGTRAGARDSDHPEATLPVRRAVGARAGVRLRDHRRGTRLQPVRRGPTRHAGGAGGARAHVRRPAPRPGWRAVRRSGRTRPHGARSGCRARAASGARCHDPDDDRHRAPALRGGGVSVGSRGPVVLDPRTGVAHPTPPPPTTPTRSSGGSIRRSGSSCAGRPITPS